MLQQNRERAGIIQIAKANLVDDPVYIKNLDLLIAPSTQNSLPSSCQYFIYQFLGYLNFLLLL